jgi:hypothetical protein
MKHNTKHEVDAEQNTQLMQKKAMATPKIKENRKELTIPSLTSLECACFDAGTSKSGPLIAK